MIRGVRAQGSLFGSSTLTPPWSLHFVDGAPLTLCAVLGGGGWVVPEGHPPEPLRPGDTVIVRGPGTFTFVDEVGTRATPVACGEFCTAPEEGGTRHRRGWHDPGDTGAGGDTGATTLIVGAYPVRGEISRRLLDALPTVVRVDSGGEGDPVLEHLAAEVATDTPGQQVVLDRLLDWLLVCSIRTWFDRPGGKPPAWYAAQRDPVVGDALRLLHAGGLRPRDELVHGPRHRRRHDVDRGDAPQGGLPAGGVGPVEAGPAGTRGGAHRHAVQSQARGDPSAGLAGGAEDEGGVRAHGDESTPRR